VTQNPSKFMQSLPAILGALGALGMAIGSGYETLAQSHPEVSALLGWPTGLAGLLAQVGAFMVAQNNTAKAAASPPEPPKDGTDPIAYTISIAVQQAFQAGKTELVKDLAIAAEKAKAVKS
jgi:hypothetical protein